jgi:branched-chain amino acid transport system permease protein
MTPAAWPRTTSSATHTSGSDLMNRFVDLTLNGVSTGAIYAAVALALVLIWRSTRIVNFAQGGMLMITTFIASSVIAKTGSYWAGLAVALASGLVMGAVIERVLIRRVEGGPPLNAVIVTLGLLVLCWGVAGMIWGGQERSFPPAFTILGFFVGGRHILFSPDSAFIVGAVVVVAAALAVLFRATPVGLRMRAAAFNPDVARLAGVRVGRMLTLGWALAAVAGSLAGVLVAPSTFLGPNTFDATLVFGFTAAIVGGLDSPVGAVTGGVLLGLVLSYVSGYAGASLVNVASLGVIIAVLMVRPGGLFSHAQQRRV